MSKHGHDYDGDLDDLFGGEDISSHYPESPLTTNNKAFSTIYPPMPEHMPMPQPPSDPVHLPLPMPMPTHITMPEQPSSGLSLMPMPMPMPVTEALKDTDYKYCQTFQQPQATQDTSHVSDTAGDQWQDVFKAVQSTAGQDLEKQRNLSALFQQFLKQQAMGTAPASSPYTNSKVALPAQLQPKANPPPAGAKISHSRNKKGDHRIGQFDWYDTPPVRKSWMANDGGRQVPIKYTKKGELRHPASLTRGDIEAYIHGCAERGIPLRLWIQNIPTIHTDRYHHADHHKCRVKDCAAKGTLGRGAYQVCFDEHPTETTNGRYDPFHVTAYMHLFCLEELIPMAHLMEFADVQPDVRELPLEERNPMSLRRDGSHVIEKLFYEWKTTHHDSYVKTGFPISKAPRKRDNDCLYYNMTKKKLESQPSTRQKTRDKRNGNDISKHYGNLRKEEANRNASKRKRKQARFCSDSSSVVEIGDAGNLGSLQGFSFNPMPPPSPKRQRLSGAYRPTLQTAAAHAMQSQSSAVLPSPLRRSRRLSGAHAIDNIIIPPSSAFTNYRTGYTPRLRTGLTPGLQTSHGVRSSLNVRTDNVSLSLDKINYTPNIDGLVYDFTGNAYDQYLDQELGKITRAANGNTGSPNNIGSGSANAAGNAAHFLHFGQVSTPCGTYGVTTTPVPYGLRATPARRETAIKQTSARISLTEGIRCDEKKLIEAIKSPGLPMKTPTVLPRTSQTVQPVPQQGGFNADPLLSPARRVTRSMSRNVSAVEQPYGQDYDFQLSMLYPDGLDGFQDGFFNLDSFS